MINSINNANLVSVVIPVYNCEKYVSEAIESVLSQTYKPLEIIVVDDGSTDNSANIIAKYKKNINVISQKNSGAAVARNNGISRAQGKYIAFLDADDEWFSDKLEKQVELLKKHNDVILISGLWECQDENGCNKEFDIIFDEKLFNRPVNLYRYLLVNGNPVWTSSVLVRKDSINSIDFDCKFRRSQDYDEWIRLSEKGLFYVMNEKLGKYRIRDSSQTFSDINKEYEGQLRVINKHSWRYKSHEYSRRLARVYYDWSLSAFYYDTFRNGIKNAIIALRFQPMNLNVLWLIFTQLFKTPLKVVFKKQESLYGKSK